MKGLVVREIQHRKQLEEANIRLFQAEKLASIGELASGVAHEINNPLASILMNTQMVYRKVSRGMDDSDRERCLRQLERIEESSERCRRIVANLLDYARQTEPETKPIDINGAIESILPLIEYQFSIQGTEIIREYDSSLPPVMGDVSQLKQVFMNIITNANQAMPDGGHLWIRTRTENNQVMIEFEDTGCGIPEENLTKIFDPFFTTKGVGKGTGLGLSVSYGIIQRHHGRIEVESEVGKGSKFTVVLPAGNG
ncbi:MAG: sensor histidine kinase [bacterium]